MITTFFGYLEAAYLMGPYLTGLADAATHSQFNRIIDEETPVLVQHEQRIETDEPIKSQIARLITEFEQPVLSQFDRQSDAGTPIRTQHEQAIADYPVAIRSEFDRAIDATGVVRSQFERINEKTLAVFTQHGREITGTIQRTRSEFGRGPVSHAYCDGYLVDPYLSGPYLAPKICAHLRMQHNLVSGFRLNTQILHAIYNTTNLRILCDFPSRGNTGTNWSVIAGGTAAGDFGVNNVNSDIVEQVYRSTAKVVTIQCDTQVSQGIFNDTLAILGHNLTTSAIVTMQGSNDPTFSTVGISETLDVELENLYWISEFLPQNSYRYWRFIFNDTTNAANLQMGTIVFGSSIIFNGECFTDDVVRRKTHFADRVRTEGYSAVSNDRALKRAVSLSFRRLDFNRDNYENLVGVIDYARTSLKCLWIPTPRFASRFAVFGKLSEIPVENHRALGSDADYIDMDVNVDEAL
jgi:hypothetical protein